MVSGKSDGLNKRMKKDRNKVLRTVSSLSLDRQENGENDKTEVYIESKGARKTKRLPRPEADPIGM